MPDSAEYRFRRHLKIWLVARPDGSFFKPLRYAAFHPQGTQFPDGSVSLNFTGDTMDPKKLQKWVISFFHGLDHDQRKQVATSCNTVAALVMVNYTIQGSGFSAVLMLIISTLLWVVSIIIVRKNDD